MQVCKSKALKESSYSLKKTLILGKLGNRTSWKVKDLTYGIRTS